jgi:ATP-dependent DNA ligase
MPTAQSRRARPVGPPMLSSAIDVVPDDDQYLASRKFDGWRAMVAITDQSVQVTSREGQAISSLPYLDAALREVASAGTVLDGELVDLAGPRQLKRTGTILPSNAAHKPNAASPPITFAVFDILFDGPTDLRDRPLHERLERLAALFDSDAGRQHVRPLLAGRSEPVLLLVEHRPSTSAFAQQLVDAGEEGVVVKHRGSLYRHGTRTGGWFKYKPQQTVDAECVGIVPGSSATGVGAIRFRLPSGLEGQASSGISAAEWLDMSQHPDRYEGMLLELAHHGEEKSGSLRHPVYRGMRDPRDKAAPAAAPRAPREVPRDRALTTAVAGGARKRRNYEAMGDNKLETCLGQLEAGAGDAYDRCLERGSGDPGGDLAVALEIAKRRGLRA